MRNNDGRRGSSLTLALLTLASHVSAAPSPRAPTLEPHTIQDFTTSALDMFLASKNADKQAFNVKGPWTTIDFAGATGALRTTAQINNDVFASCDTQKDRTTNKTVSFSGSYKNFVQDLNKAVPFKSPSQQMNDTSAKFTSTCYDDTLPNATNKALATYNKISTVPTTNLTDSNFLSWAATGSPDFQTAWTACNGAKLAYWGAVDDNNGNDAGVYTAARVHVEPLVDNNAAAPGINMPIQEAGTTGPVEGSFAAYYSIPTLNTTLNAWQAGSGLSKFTFGTAQYNATSSSSTKFGGAHLGLTYEGVSAKANAEHHEAKSSADVSALNFDLTFEGLALLGIDQGIWFDDYRVARAAENPDDQHKDAKAIFNKETYFGSAEKPGPLTVYNSQALVAFKPTWKITFIDSHQVDSSSSTSAGVDISILGLLEIGGYGGSTQNNTQYDNSTNTLTIQDDSNNAYIIGYVQNGYFNYS
ncbi:hypothetical protein C8R43DRAFT_1023030 [Mycena crocata]|nr:hypothetical protein C8R43DRAFT_1023030 [Mycena crocata]